MFYVHKGWTEKSRECLATGEHYSQLFLCSSHEPNRGPLAPALHCAQLANLDSILPQHTLVPIHSASSPGASSCTVIGVIGTAPATPEIQAGLARGRCSLAVKCIPMQIPWDSLHKNDTLVSNAFCVASERTSSYCREKVLLQSVALTQNQSYKVIWIAYEEDWLHSFFCCLNSVVSSCSTVVRRCSECLYPRNPKQHVHRSSRSSFLTMQMLRIWTKTLRVCQLHLLSMQ